MTSEKSETKTEEETEIKDEGKNEYDHLRKKDEYKISLTNEITIVSANWRSVRIKKTLDTSLEQHGTNSLGQWNPATFIKTFEQNGSTSTSSRRRSLVSDLVNTHKKVEQDKDSQDSNEDEVFARALNHTW